MISTENGQARPALPDDPRVVSAVEEYVNALEAGERPNRQAFIARHADIAEALAGCLDGLDFICAVGPQLDEAPSTEAAAPSPLGDFRIVREVGRGGMGIVYEAEQLSLGRRVALKVIPFAATMDPRHLQRFKNEAHAAAQLHHTNIVPVYAVGCERGVHFYAMQYIDGHTLADWIAELRGQAERAATKPQPSPSPHVDATVDARAGQVICPNSATSEVRQSKPIAALSTVRSAKDASYFRTVAELGIQAAEALDYAHEHGIFHRDIKPANLILDAESRLWVTDFGLAHVQGDARMTMTGDLVGTLRYMSPEQALAKRVAVDHRTDIYSLGATLYELLTLEPAFGGTDRQELLGQIAFEEPRPLRRVMRTIPPELEIIVLKAMEKSPMERYLTAKDLADDLRRFLKDEAIRARKPSPTQNIRKWARRHRALVWSISAVTAFAALFACASIFWIAGERAARRGAIAAQIHEALKESMDWQKSERLPEAREACRRAKTLLAETLVDDALREDVSNRERDLALWESLERALWANNDDACSEAFNRWGLDLDTVPPHAAAELIRQSTVVDELARGLDVWAITSFKTRGPEDSRWRSLFTIASDIDSDDERMQFRAKLVRGTKETFLSLADPKVAEAIVPESQGYLLGFVHRLLETPDRQRLVPLLRDLQRRHPTDVYIMHTLADILEHSEPPRYEDAIGYHRARLALRSDNDWIRVKIGELLEKLADFDNAIAEYREAVNSSRARTHRPYEHACERLGDALIQHKADVDAAIRAYREGIDWQLPEGTTWATGPSLHGRLGYALKMKGLFRESLEQYRLCHKKNIRQSGSPLHSDKWVHEAEALVDLEEKLPAILGGTGRASSSAEWAACAMVSYYKQMYASAARFFLRSFAQRPSLLSVTEQQDSYNAACAAALAGCGQGKDADQADPTERVRLRRQALDWLRADLTAWCQLFEKEPDKVGPVVVQTMQHWQQDQDFLGVRGEALRKLSEAEHLEWEKMWQEVEALRQLAAKPTKNAGS
jgi:serine/threonine protein kinase